MTLLELMLNCINQSCPFPIRCKSGEDCYEIDINSNKPIREFGAAFCNNILTNLLNSPERIKKMNDPESNSAAFSMPNDQILRMLKNWGSGPHKPDNVRRAGATIHQIRRAFAIQESVSGYLHEESEYIQKTIELSVVYKKQKKSNTSGNETLITDFDLKRCRPQIINEFLILEERMKEKDIFRLLEDIHPEFEKLTRETFLDFKEQFKEYDVKTIQIQSAFIAAILLISITLPDPEEKDPGYSAAIQNIVDCLRKMIIEIEQRPAASKSQDVTPSDEVNSLIQEDANGALFSPFLKNSSEQLTETKKIRYEKGKNPKIELLSEIRLEDGEKNPVFPSLSNTCARYRRMMHEYFEQDFGIRMLLTGNKVSGRTTHLLLFWEEILEKNDPSSPDAAVLYVPAENLNRSNMPLLSYIGHVYFPTEIRAFRNSPERVNDRIIDILQTISEQKQIFFLMDDCDLLSDEDMNMFETLFIEGNMLGKVNVITTARKGGFEWNNVQKMSLIGIPDSSISSLLSRNGRNLSPDDPVYPYLKSPWFLKLYLDYPVENEYSDTTISETGFSVTLIHESLEQRIQTYESKHSGKNRIPSEVIRFSMSELLPRITVCGVFEKNTLKNQLVSQLVYLQKNKDFFIDRSFDQKLFMNLISEVIPEPDKAYDQFIRRPLVTILDLLRTGKKTRSVRGQGKEPLLWNETVIENYYHAYGLCQLLFDDQTPESVSSAINHLHHYAESMIRYYNADDHSPDGLSGYDRSCFFLELLNEDEVKILCKKHAEVMFLLFAGIAMICDSHGDEAERYKYATMALDLIRNGDFREKSDPSLICTMAYFIIKYNPGTQKPVEYDEQKQTAFQKLEEMLSQDFDPILKSNIYSDIGAYYQRSKDPDRYDKAQKYYDESLHLRQSVYDALSSESISDDEMLKKRNLILRSLRRCYVQQATNAFYKHDWDTSIAYHKQAMELGEKITDPRRYESYSRIVGSELAKRGIDKNDPGYTLSQADAIYLLELLTEDIRIMKESRRINRKELKDIHKHAVKILGSLKMKKYAYTEDKKKSIRSCIEQISELFLAYESADKEKLTASMKEVLK